MVAGYDKARALIENESPTSRARGQEPLIDRRHMTLQGASAPFVISGARGAQPEKKPATGVK
jgi:hypothetical protein